ncbi:MAG: type II toxin-antitoxin system HicB family antitoxin [Euryarchaeota archaeon]|nr:type II toxin-antitoxin system HicB family antitoxin [Euryarchaeota archaeon]
MARCPELGVTSQGESLVEAQKNLKEAIELYIESFGLEDLPRVSVNPYWTTVEVENLQKVRYLTSYIKQG